MYIYSFLSGLLLANQGLFSFLVAFAQDEVQVRLNRLASCLRNEIVQKGVGDDSDCGKGQVEYDPSNDVLVADKFEDISNYGVANPVACCRNGIASPGQVK